MKSLIPLALLFCQTCFGITYLNTNSVGGDSGQAGGAKINANFYELWAHDVALSNLIAQARSSLTNLDTVTSNGLHTIILNASNVLRLISVNYSNSLAVGYKAADTVVSNGVVTLLRAGDAATSNNFILHGKGSFTTNYTMTETEEVYNLNGTNQLLTLLNCTNSTAWRIYRFSCTNQYGSFTLTNANGVQTIRDGVSLDYKNVGVNEVGLYHDGAVWWIASRAKVRFPNASWSTSTNIPVVNSGSNYITFDTAENNNGQGIGLNSGYKIYVTNSGQYMITFSAVLAVGHNNDWISVWLQQNGTNVPRTTTTQQLSSTTQEQCMTVNYIMPVSSVTYFSLLAAAKDTGCAIVSSNATATMSAMPSMILTVNKVSDSAP